MFYRIENDLYTVEVNEMGAELHSFKSKADGTEYIWYGKTEIWYGQAPVLFPVVGQVKNDTYTYQGKAYTMPKHGLARKLPFTVKEQQADKIVFSLKSDANTREKYPFDFELLITYALEGNKLVAGHTVINLTEGEMFFSLGAHPGFNCEVGDTIEFEQAETVATERIDKENLIIDNEWPLLNNEKAFTVTKEIFEPDALILHGLQSKKLTLKHQKGGALEFAFGDAPFLGIWAKPGAPYVCLEPWYGVNDSHADYGEISNKRAIQRLEKGETFYYQWTAEPVIG